MKKIKNIFYLYLYRKEKEVILLHLFERNKFILLVEKRNGVKMIKKAAITAVPAGKNSTLMLLLFYLLLFLLVAVSVEKFH